MFVHHVFFWLRDAESQADLDRLVEGLQALSKVPTIRMHHIGVPAATRRDVIESGYSVSWLTLFDDAQGQDVYQTHPIHLEFVEACSSLWKKVVVYDSTERG